VPFKEVGMEPDRLIELFLRALVPIITLIVAVASLYWAWYYSRFQRRERCHSKWASWLIAIETECAHAVRTCDEIGSGLEYSRLVAKRFNITFFDQAKEEIIFSDRSPILFGSLTEVCHDLSLLNGMIDRYEEATVTSRSNTWRSGCIATCDSVYKSMSTLDQKINDEISLLTASEPLLFPWSLPHGRYLVLRRESVAGQTEL